MLETVSSRLKRLWYLEFTSKIWKNLFSDNKSYPKGHVCIEGSHKRFSIGNARFLSAFCMFQMLTKTTIKVSCHYGFWNTHGFLYIIKFAFYTLLSLNQSEWIRVQDSVQLNRLNKKIIYLYFMVNFVCTWAKWRQGP